MVVPKKQQSSIDLQDRDLALLVGLFECRVMTAGHIATVYFDGKRAYAEKRLRKIKAAGLVAERKRRANEPSVLFLTREAFIMLKDEGLISEYPPLSLTVLENRADVSELTLRHELEIMDVKAAFHAALAKSGKFSIVEFNTWPLLNEFKAFRPDSNGVEVSVKPDGFIRVHETDADGKFEHAFFLEVDRSSETQDTLIAKAGCYLDYYRRGGFAVRNGATRDDFKQFPFRVLIVLKSAERRNNLAERLAHNTPPILTMTWLSTFEEVAANPLGAIWIQPKDYRDVTKGTPFYNERPNRDFAYRHQPEREAFIESKIPKLRLLES